MNKILESLAPFCQEKNLGNATLNTEEPTPRVKFLLSLLDELEIPYELDTFIVRETPFHNIILRGTSNRMVIAHHDIVNPDSDNANDNSASVINAIYLKSLVPELNVVLTDGEEVGFVGANHLAKQILCGDFGDIEWVLNIELSGSGGKNFMIGAHQGKLTEHILGIFDAPVVQTPPSDCYAISKYGIDTNVINPLPMLLEGESGIKQGDSFLDNSSWYLCHSKADSLDKVSLKDMNEFVTEVLYPIVTHR
jgi:hypothetical protein